MQKKKKTDWSSIYKEPRTFILFVVTIALACVAIFLFVTRPTRIDRLSMDYIDTMNHKDVKDHVKSSFKESFKVKDYTIYGETLKLYENDYANDSTDKLQGVNVVLNNVETQVEYNFVMNDGIDSGIQLGELDEGLYEIYVYDHFVKKRVFFSEPVQSDSFNTIRRKDTVKTVQLNANKDLLESFKVSMDKNYAFLSVMENIPMVKNIDVVIDPCGNVYNELNNTVDPGASNDKISEATASMELAKLVQKELEDAGLRVELTRNEEDTPSYYGKSGRAGIGYEKNAKVFLSLGMFTDDYITRPLMRISPYSLGYLANEVGYAMKQGGLEMHWNQYSENLEPGIMYDSLSLDSDGKYTKFEMYPQLRETGGKCTFAGQADMAKSNKQYANRYGMNAIHFQFANIDNNDSIDYYLQNKEKIAKQLAQGIINYYEIEGMNSETTTQ